MFVRTGPSQHLPRLKSSPALVVTESMLQRNFCGYSPVPLEDHASHESGARSPSTPCAADTFFGGQFDGLDINLFSFVRLMQDRSHKSAGSIRASISHEFSRHPDAFLRFITGFRDQTRLTIGDVTFDIESCRIIRDGSSGPGTLRQMPWCSSGSPGITYLPCHSMGSKTPSRVRATIARHV